MAKKVLNLGTDVSCYLELAEDRPINDEEFEATLFMYAQGLRLESKVMVRKGIAGRDDATSLASQGLDGKGDFLTPPARDPFVTTERGIADVPQVKKDKVKRK